MPKRNVLVTLGWYDPRIIEGIGRFAREAGWHLEMRAMIEGSPPRNWKGDGMLVNDTEVPRLNRFIQNQIRQQPTVLIGSNHRYGGLPSVREDNHELGRLAAVHFLERAHQNFAWFSLQRGGVELGRREGFVRALAESGKSCELLEWSRERGGVRDSWENRRAWLARRLEALPKPLAMFVLDDLLAMDAVEVCLDLGLRVPEDVAVMGVGNMELACECARIPISSVDENLTEMSYRAAALLHELMNEKAAGDWDISNPEPLVVPVKGVLLRRSTDSMAVVHPGLKKAIAFISAESSRMIGIADVARASCLSQRALQYVFKSELGRTPAQHLVRVRLEKARHLLVSTDLKVGAIAQQCGFGTVRHLHRTFMKAFECSPQSFRNKTGTGRKTA